MTFFLEKKKVDLFFLWGCERTPRTPPGYGPEPCPGTCCKTFFIENALYLSTKQGMAHGPNPPHDQILTGPRLDLKNRI